MGRSVFYVLWVLTVLIFIGVYWIIGAQQAVARDLQQSLGIVEAAIGSEDWPDAARGIGDVYERWRKIEKLWALHTQHEQLDLVSDALLEAQALIDIKNADAVRSLRLAAERLHALPDRDRLLFSNLL